MCCGFDSPYAEGGVLTNKRTQPTSANHLTWPNNEVVPQNPDGIFSLSNINTCLVLSLVLCQEVTKRHCETWLVPSTLALALCTNNDTPQLHDRDEGSDDDDDESGYGADSYDDDIVYHMKDGGVDQIELCRYQIVHSDVVLPVNCWLRFHLWWFKQIIVRALTKRNERF